PPPDATEPAPRAHAAGATVSGTVTGGGSHGPGGAVIWLKRIGGETPKPAPARGKVVTQRNKTLIPHVLVVPVGTKVSFRNEDRIFHNIFSLSKPNDFDTGLYKQGATYQQTFKHTGVVQILCNIHSSMLGVIVVVDTPYFAQAEASGAFSIKGLTPGEYELKVWHEAASKLNEQRLTVGPGGVRGLSLQVGGDKRAPQFVPDKSGKPRQSHIGYCTSPAPIDSCHERPARREAIRFLKFGRSRLCDGRGPPGFAALEQPLLTGRRMRTERSGLCFSVALAIAACGSILQDPGDGGSDGAAGHDGGGVACRGLTEAACRARTDCTAATCSGICGGPTYAGCYDHAPETNPPSP